MTAELSPSSDAFVLSDSIRVPPGAAPAILYLGELHTEYSKRTMRSALNLFARWGGAADFTQVNWAMLTPAAVSSFLRRQLALGKSGVSVNLYLAALKGVAKAAWQLELLDHDSLERIRSVKQVRVSRLPAGRSLSYAESAALLSAAAGDDPKKVRDRAILTLFLGCGLRRAEVCGLQLDKVDVFGGTIRLIGKGNKERIVPLGAKAKDEIRCYLKKDRDRMKKARGFEDILFLNKMGKSLSRVMIFNIIKETALRAGLNKVVSPHTFRHSFASHLVNGGADIRTVQDMLGHESILTTEIYTHLDNSYLRDTITNFHPRAKKSRK